MDCRNCGSEVTDRNTIQAAVQQQYNFTNEEFNTDKIIVKAWHPDCAIADGRIDDKSELDEGLNFYWEARSA